MAGKMIPEKQDKSRHTTPAQSYKDLIVWQKSIVLVMLVYQLTRKFPPDEKFCLTS